MSICVQINPDGTLTPTGQPVSECAGYVLVSSAEHGVYALVQEAFGMPEPAVIAGWFSGSVGTVLLFYMASYYVGQVVAMFRS